MAAKLLDGKVIAEQIKQDVLAQLQELKEKRGVTPGLAVILVGENPASKVYVRRKEKACEELGIFSVARRVPETTTQEEVIRLVDELNADPKIHGILVQLPLPQHIDPEAVMARILPEKDVDGFHPMNAGYLFVGRNRLVPCTPNGIVEMLERSGIGIQGKRAVIIGRSNIVGKPLAMLLMQKNATVTVCHSRTQDLAGEARRADILVAAMGKPKFVTKDMVKEGAVVVDVGINRVGDELVGDVDFAAVKEVASWITPVPGGVGPLTIIMLMGNAVKAARMIHGLPG